MSETSPITGELSNSKVAAVFASESAARQAAGAVAKVLALGPAQVQVVTPAEPHPGRKLEPEERGIWNTIVVAHVRLGIVGAIVGLLAFLAMYFAGLPFVTLNALAAGLVLLFFGAVAGLNCRAPVVVDDMSPTLTSFPGFADLLRELAA